MKAKAYLTGNSFVGNQALAYTETANSNNLVNVRHEGAGGAIFFSCVDVTDTQSIYVEEFDAKGQPTCEVDLNGNSFINNTASNKGGALMWTNRNFTEKGR